MNDATQYCITATPHPAQFVINELPWLILCPVLIILGGWDGFSFGYVISLFGVLMGLALAYRFIYLCRTVYRVNGEQLIHEHGILQRQKDYIELYRVVDFYEGQNLLQQLLGLKTVSIFSGDRTSPRLDMIGLKENLDYVKAIRERVEIQKRRKGIYEITNR